MTPSLLTFVVAIVGMLTYLVTRPSQRDGTEEAMAKLAARLKALEEPRPERAPVATVPGDDPLEGAFQVPARATVFPRANRTLAGKMLAFRTRWAPDRTAVALQLRAPYVGAAVVFDAATHDVLWEPEGAVDLVFRERAREAVTIEHVHRARPELRRGPVRIESPLQAEIAWSITRWRWPERARVCERGITFPQGWAHELVLSPDETRLCVQFVDQTEAGWIVVDLDAEGMPSHRAHFQRRASLVGTPAFSPDGRHVACAATADWDWWLPPRDEGGPRAISGRDYAAYAEAQREKRRRGAAGGPVRAGWVFVQRLDTDEVDEHELVLDLAAGWGGERDEEDVAPIGPIRFVDDHVVEVVMQDGTKRTVPTGSR